MIIEKMIESVIFQMKLAEIVSESDEEIYRFGLECFLLKILHCLSYLLISFILHMTIPMLVSTAILMPLRSKAGGYHAKTRYGCYLFSCFMVFLLCCLNKTVFPIGAFWVTVVTANIMVWCLAPVAHPNRKLQEIEQKEFKKQALFLLGASDIIIAVATVTMGYTVSQWMLNGLLITAILMLLGKYKNTVDNQES